MLQFVFHMGKGGPTCPTGPWSSGQNKLPKADPSCLPSLPLSGDFNHSAEALLCAKAALRAHLLSSVFIYAPGFFVYLPPFGRCYSCWHLMLTNLGFYETCHNENNFILPTAVPPASLVSLSLCFHSVENQEPPQMCLPKAIMLCFNNIWAVLCFWLCYSIHFNLFTEIIHM